MEGNPAPIIEWSKGEQMVDYQMTRYRTSKKSLRIRDVDKTDSGRFTCKGINGFGKEEIKIDLIIIDPLDFPGLPEGALPEVTPPALTSDTLTARTKFSKKPEETLRISCGALGKPKPVITWYKNGHELLETGGNFEDLLRSPWQTKAGDHVVQERARAAGECEGEARQVRTTCARTDGQRLRQVHLRCSKHGG